MKPRKIPMRMCVGCREMKEKRELIRIVRTPEGETLIDGMTQNVRPGDVVTILAGCKHRIRALSELTLIEGQLGQNITVHDKRKYQE